MFNQHRIRTTLWGAAAIALLASATSIAQGFAERDSREIGSYVLTDAGLAKYQQAIKNLGPLARGMADDCGNDDDSVGAKSLDEMVARVEAVPGVKAAITSAGLTTRDYLVFTLSLFQNGMAAWALSQPGGKLPAGTSMANVNFYKAHQTAINKLGDATKAGHCDSGDNEDDSQASEDDSREQE